MRTGEAFIAMPLRVLLMAIAQVLHLSRWS